LEYRESPSRASFYETHSQEGDGHRSDELNGKENRRIQPHNTEITASETQSYASKISQPGNQGQTRKRHNPSNTSFVENGSAGISESPG
jgi:hypothetical protein